MQCKCRNAVFHGTLDFFERLQTKFNVYQTEKFKRNTINLFCLRNLI